MANFLFSDLQFLSAYIRHFFLVFVLFPPALPNFKQLSLLTSYLFRILVDAPTHFQLILQKSNDLFFLFKLLRLLKQQSLLVKELGLDLGGFVLENGMAFYLLVP